MTHSQATTAGLREETPFISVIIPVKNAARFLPQCLASLNSQDYPKDKYEVIVSDSTSSDNTREIASSLGARVVIAEGESVCAGRNSGFQKAKGSIIAFSDADCVMDKSWLGNAVKYFADPNVACVGGPSLIPRDETPFGKACGFIFSYRIFTGGSTYGLKLNQVKTVPHNPGCNAIYRKSALDKVMPVDECFIEGEDVVMNKRIRDIGYTFLYTPDTLLWHYRSSTPKRFWRQNFRYAIGRLLIGRAFPELINPLHKIVGFSLPLIIFALLGGFILGFDYLFNLAIIAGGLLFFFFVLAWVKTGSFNVALNTPYAILILMTAWSLGFLKEYFRPSKAAKR